LYDRAFSLFGLSKTFGLPGLRIGWIVSRNHDLLHKLSLFKDYTTICNSAPSEVLAIMALSNKDKIIAAHKTRIRKHLRVLDEFFHEYQDCFEWNRPLGGSVCFPKLRASRDTFLFCEELVRECGIMLVPSRMFMYGDNHVRIGYGRKDLPAVVERFGHYLKRRFR